MTLNIDGNIYEIYIYDIEYSVVGHYRPATFNDPPEYPDMEIEDFKIEVESYTNALHMMTINIKDYIDYDALTEHAWSLYESEKYDYY